MHDKSTLNNIRNGKGKMQPYDPRAIANLLLDQADSREIEVTNLALQKLLYFAHGLHLTQTKVPLVSGYFEAWQYGPVHPTAYQAFKSAGPSPIRMRATGQDPLTGKAREIETPSNFEVRDLIGHILHSYGRMSPGRLVDLSHAKNSPWAFIVDKARTNVVFGMRIPDNVILERFRYHKVSVDIAPRSGEPNTDDTPFT